MIVKPDDERMSAFEWRIVNANVLLLVDQRRPSPNGGNYIDATLSRLKSGKPSAARGQ